MGAPDLSAWQALADDDPAAASRLLRQFARKLFVPHEGGQQDVIESPARFKVLRAGRRWGKTEVASSMAIKAALEEGAMVWWVSNSDKNVRRGYRKVLQHLPEGLLSKPAPSPDSQNRVLHLATGSLIEFYTAGSAGGSGRDSSPLTGEGVDFLVVDEAALIDEMVWYQHLRPTLMDTNGSALIISTPRGRNWFWKLWNRGQKPGNEYDSWHFTSYDNPYGHPSDIEDAKDTLPDLVFRQEYLAEFVANAASIFAMPETVIVDRLAEPEKHVTLGIDLGKREDFTVISGCNTETRLPCFYDRWTDIRWTDQLTLISDTVRSIEEHPSVEGVTLAVDSTGLGDVVFDQLEDAGFDVVPINFGGGADNRQKEQMVRLLAADIEQGRSYVYSEMLDEFENYEYEIRPSGRWAFEAATGHDDKVSAKLLENWCVTHEGPPGMRSEGAVRTPEQRSVTELSAEVEVIEPDPVTDLMNRPEVWR